MFLIKSYFNQRRDPYLKKERLSCHIKYVDLHIIVAYSYPVCKCVSIDHKTYWLAFITVFTHSFSPCDSKINTKCGHVFGHKSLLTVALDDAALWCKRD